MFLQYEFQKKQERLLKLDWSRDVTGSVNIIQTLFFPSKFRLRKQIQDFQKLFRGDIFLCWLNIFAIAAPT